MWYFLIAISEIEKCSWLRLKKKKNQECASRRKSDEDIRNEMGVEGTVLKNVNKWKIKNCIYRRLN